jgi:branched-chain amino acid transport system permease protein
VTAGFGALLALPALRVTGPYFGNGDAGLCSTIIQILIEMTFLTS